MFSDDEPLPGEMPEDFDRFHCYPINDTYEHQMSMKCPCMPIEDDGIVIHNSFDGREAYETGKRKAH